MDSWLVGSDGYGIWMIVDGRFLFIDKWTIFPRDLVMAVMTITGEAVEGIVTGQGP